MSLIGKRKGRPTTRMQFDALLKRFLVFLKRELRLTYDIPYVLIDDSDFAKDNMTFGMMKKNILYISIVNRHPIDILRTVSHEFIHYKQVVDGKKITSQPGSPAENEANAKAGEIMRKYGRLHPELFDLMPLR
jgi:hypothetical protein